MTLRSLDLETVELVPHLLWMRERVDLTLYTVTEWTLIPRQRNNGVRMTLTLQRKLMNEMMTTFLPSILLILISKGTTFFKAQYFEAALTVNLTTMLMMTTLFIGVMQKLPATAYVKMVDIWLIFSTLVPFCEVVLLTTKELYKNETLMEIDEKEKKITHWLDLSGKNKPNHIIFKIHFFYK